MSEIPEELNPSVVKEKTQLDTEAKRFNAYSNTAGIGGR